VSVLLRILDAKRSRLDAGLPQPDAVPALPSDGRRFERALRGGGTRVLAEIKHRSPSAGVLLPDAGRQVERQARAYRRGGAAALSVVTEQDFFGGDPFWIPRAKGASGLPVLMKDFVLDERQLDLALALGADAVLLIAAALDDEALRRLHGAALSRGLAALVEAHTEEEARRALAAGARIVGVNARDLATFSLDLERTARIGAGLPLDVLRVAESGLSRRAEVEGLSASFDAFLIGGTLLLSPDPARALRELRGEGTTEVKVCGITRAEDLDPCAEAGVDYIGLNFSPRSPRRVTPRQADGLARAASFARGVVAVFAGNEPGEIREVAEAVRPDVLQLTDPPFDLRPSTFDSPVWQTVRVGRDDLSRAAAWPGAALLFDTAVGGLSGGTGATFDWTLLDRLPRDRPWVLAGGLRPENVAGAVRAVRPDVVDVASGVESAPGVKDPARVNAFVREVRGAAN